MYINSNFTGYVDRGLNEYCLTELGMPAKVFLGIVNGEKRLSSLNKPNKKIFNSDKGKIKKLSLKRN